MLFTYRLDEDRAKEFKAPTKTGLKPLEAELQRIEQLASHVVAESDHQKDREATHRNTSGTLTIIRFCLYSWVIYKLDLTNVRFICRLIQSPQSLSTLALPGTLCSLSSALLLSALLKSSISKDTSRYGSLSVGNSHLPIHPLRSSLLFYSCHALLTNPPFVITSQKTKWID